MSGASRGQGLWQASIPPIEIGSFAALQPDKSEFIGSASGVFFVNTVFRAFAAASAGPDAAAQSGEGTSAPDPGSAHSYVAETENTQAQSQALDSNAVSNATTAGYDAGNAQARSYGIGASGLGVPPSAATAQKLLMQYFRDWHPFFPFLHGPTFINEINQFYEKEDDGNAASSSLDPGRRLGRAVTFQCVFNIAASRGLDEFEPSSRIQSATALLGLLGTLSNTHDVHSLQAMLAVELYLITTMSLRAASTVHGTLVRMLYHTGYHRCPFRFVQLPRPMCDLRKRVFWSAYVLDRYLSQALGHPMAFRDDEVDVCTPSMAELHKPVKPRDQNSNFGASPVDEVREHLPTDQARQRQTIDNEVAESTGPDARMELSVPDIQSPAHHHRTPEAAGEYVQGYLVTYSRLLGSSLDLLHRSIHRRSITWDKVLEITYQTHAWWNSLPSALQDISIEEVNNSRPNFSGFFAIIYHYLILFINRPFLSLPTHTVEFQSSLQAALGASRSILALKLHREFSSPSAWPGTLSATWMSGLIVAYATLLELYPREKAIGDLNICLVALDGMGSRWPSARHCRMALKTLLDRLALVVNYRQSQSKNLEATGVSQPSSTGIGPSFPNHVLRTNGESSNKRRRHNSGLATSVPAQPSTQSDFSGFSLGSDLSDMRDWQPVLEYTGPDFGFDAEQFATTGEWQAALDPNMNTGPSGVLFNNAAFDAYVQYFGNNLNF